MSITGLKAGVYLKDGTYKIEGTLGQGTFGITYLASALVVTEGNLGKLEVKAKVAIKEFFMGEVNSRREDSSEVDGSSGKVFTNYREKFRKEALTLSKLSHPKIVKVLDVFDENNTTYYVMEFIEGTNLDDYIHDRGSIPEQEAIKILKDIGGALIYMHNKKMLHLDLKPKNIMLRNDGTPCLIDFGLAKQFTEDGEPESSTSIGLGTSGYAPIEQAQFKQGGSFPATLDVYALGATLFKMLTGRRVPDAPTILNEGFPEDEVKDAGVSLTTIQALKKAMFPIAKQRTQSVRDFISALDSAHSEREDDHTIFEDDGTKFEKEHTEADENAKGVRLDSKEAGKTKTQDRASGPVTITPSTSPDSWRPPYSKGNQSQVSVSNKKETINRLKYVIITIITALIISFIFFAIRYFGVSHDAGVPYSQEGSKIQVEEKVIQTVSGMNWKSPLGAAVYSGEVIPDTIEGTGNVIPHGTGIATIIGGEFEGNTYEGEFYYGHMEGRTKYTLKNGDEYVGKFKANKYDRGRYKSKSSGQYFEGTFVNGQPAKGNWYDKKGNKIKY